MRKPFINHRQFWALSIEVWNTKVERSQLDSIVFNSGPT